MDDPWTPQRSSSDAGFTVIEVIIAVVLMSAVVSAIALAAASGVKTRGSAKLQVSLTGAGSAIQKDISNNRSWMKKCTTIDVECDVSNEGVIRAESKELDGFDGTVEIVKAVVIPLDSAVDKLGAADEDGVVPDFHRIVIELRPDADTRKRYTMKDSLAPRRFVTTIDPHGELAEGSLVVEICNVTNQTDERMTVQGCKDTGTSSIRMGGCLNSTDTKCTFAYNWIDPMPVDETTRSPFVVMRRVAPTAINFRIIDSLGKVYLSSDLSSGNKANGVYTFNNLPAGEVNIVDLPDTYSGNERWQTKEIPDYLGTTLGTGHPVAIEPGVRNRALALYRPKSEHTITLNLKRTTDTYRLSGPQSSGEIVVPQWAPTESFVGVSTTDKCAAYKKFLTITCTGVVEGVPAPNCSTMYMKERVFSLSTKGNWVQKSFSAVEWYWSSVPAGTGTHVASGWTAPEPYFQSCTEFWQDYSNTFYSVTGAPESNTRPGAVASATYYVQPQPDFRATRRANPSDTNVSVPVAQCEAQGHQTGVPDPDPTCLIPDLTPGLNSGVHIQAGTRTWWNGKITPENPDVNQQNSGTPAWMASGALWIRANGAIDSPGGSVGADPIVNLLGEGECYWENPARFSGEAEGPCDPCSPMWTTSMNLVDACSVLTKTNWCRYAREGITYVGYGGGPYYSDLPTVCGEINYDPPWQCSTPTPKVIGNTCKPVPASPPKSIGQTAHPSSSSGTGYVGEQSSVTIPPG